MKTGEKMGTKTALFTYRRRYGGQSAVVYTNRNGSHASMPVCEWLPDAQRARRARNG